MTEQPWLDLATNRPGQTARERANAEYERAKSERGKVWAWLGKTLDVKTDERAWRVGAAGEESIGEELEKLRPLGWRLLHSVPVGKGESDIDHVLISPTGFVLTVNSKHHPDAKVWVSERQIRVNGTPVPYLRNSTFEAQRAGKLLKAASALDVQTGAVLIFRLGADGALTVKGQPEAVTVYRATKAWKPIRDTTPDGGLAPEQVDSLFEAARRSTTWTST